MSIPRGGGGGTIVNVSSAAATRRGRTLIRGAVAAQLRPVSAPQGGPAHPDGVGDVLRPRPVADGLGDQPPQLLVLSLDQRSQLSEDGRAHTEDE
jgi:hypothetical protein